MIYLHLLCSKSQGAFRLLYFDSSVHFYYISYVGLGSGDWVGRFISLSCSSIFSFVYDFFDNFAVLFGSFFCWAWETTAFSHNADGIGVWYHRQSSWNCHLGKITNFDTIKETLAYNADSPMSDSGNHFHSPSQWFKWFHLLNTDR